MNQRSSVVWSNTQDHALEKPQDFTTTTSHKHRHHRSQNAWRCVHLLSRERLTSIPTQATSLTYIALCWEFQPLALTFSPEALCLPNMSSPPATGYDVPWNQLLHHQHQLPQTPLTFEEVSWNHRRAQGIFYKEKAKGNPEKWLNFLCEEQTEWGEKKSFWVKPSTPTGGNNWSQLRLKSWAGVLVLSNSLPPGLLFFFFFLR